MQRRARAAGWHRDNLLRTVELMDRRNESRNNRLNEWFHRWSTPIRRRFGRRPPAPRLDIDTLAQKVFERLKRDGDDVEVDDPLRHLFRIVGDVANEWREGGWNSPAHDARAPDKVRMEVGTGSENTAELARKRLQAALEGLPQRQREALLLHFRDGLTCKQIAHKQGLTYRTVLQDVINAYGRLRRRLNLDEIEALDELDKEKRIPPLS